MQGKQKQHIKGAYTVHVLMKRPDLLTDYGKLEPGARFAAGGGYGCQAVFDCFPPCRRDMA